MLPDLLSLLGIRLTPRNLFRSVSKTLKVTSSSLQSATTQAPLVRNVGQLNGYLSGSLFMFYGFRSAAADSMALADVGQLYIMGKHLGWTTSKIALHYIKLGYVLNLYLDWPRD